jgi:ABC-type polysaccharide/polyol phosphate transport system ATPase subunit
LDPIISLRDVVVSYRLEKSRTQSLKEWFGRMTRRSLEYDTFDALRGVDLDVQPGERVGVIGRNGSGKTTLLRVVAGVLIPTQGKVAVGGDVAPLMSIAIGFNGELTGRENIIIGGLLRGRRRAEILEQMENIVEGAGLEEFIDSPIRTYSSGMQSRLAFSVATAWTADVVLLDEVLSVGDAEIRERSKKRMEALQGEGASVLLVSHDLGSIRSMCSRCIWLDRGRVVADGPAPEITQQYQQAVSAGGASAAQAG